MGSVCVLGAALSTFWSDKVRNTPKDVKHLENIKVSTTDSCAMHAKVTASVFLDRRYILTMRIFRLPQRPALKSFLGLISRERGVLSGDLDGREPKHSLHDIP